MVTVIRWLNLFDGVGRLLGFVERRAGDGAVPAFEVGTRSRFRRGLRNDNAVSVARRRSAAVSHLDSANRY